MLLSVPSLARMFCRLALVGLLLASSFAVLFQSQPVGAQNDEVDYSTLLLAKEDLPADWQTDLTDKMKELPSDWQTYLTNAIFRRRFNGNNGSTTALRHINFMAKLHSHDPQYYIPDEDFSVEGIASVEELDAGVYVYPGEDDARSAYSKARDVLVAAQSNPKEGDRQQEVIETYGDESYGFWITGLPLSYTRALKLVYQKGEKGNLVSPWQKPDTPCSGSIYDSYLKGLVIIFRVRNLLAVFMARWIEGIPLQTNTLTFSCSWEWGRTENSKYTFLEPINICDSTTISGILEKWSMRIAGASQQPVIIEVKTSKSMYEIGEPVTISGSVKRWNEQAKTYEGVKKAPFVMTFELPMGSSNPKTITFSAKGKNTITGDDGTFSFTPFAPFFSGEYKITIQLDGKDYPELQEKKLNVLTKIARFKANEPDTTPSENQMPKIEDLFRSGVVSHQIQVKAAIELARSKDMIWQTLFPNPYPESKLGLANNLLESFGAVPPGFGCIAYQAKTMSFLNDLRFYPERYGMKNWNENPLRGIHYLPLRATWKVGVGIQSLAEEYIGGSLGEHHFVVLYKEVGGWNEIDNIIMDPWLTQSPVTYKLGKFGSLLGKVVPVEIVLDPEWSMSGIFWIYWNLNDDVVRRVLSIGYPGGNPELGLQATDQAFALSAMRSLITKSPVALDISSDDGKRVALLEDGTFLDEIEGSQVFISPNSGTDLEWYVWLPEGRYDVKLRGLGDGEFHLLTGRQSTLQYYGAPIKKDEVATVQVGTGNPAEPMTLPNGAQLTPVTIDISTIVTTTTMVKTSSQNFTTTTSWTTVTTVVTSARHSTLVATTVMTGTATRTLLTDTETSFTVEAATSGGCHYRHVTYDAVAGQRLVGDLTSDKPLNFYLMSKNQFVRYGQAACGEKVDAYLFIAETKSYTLDWVVPQDGAYYFIFENYGSARNQDVKGTFALYEVLLQPTTLTVYSTASAEIEYTTTMSLSSVYSTQISQPFSIVENQTVVIAVLLFAVLFGLVFVTLRRKARKMSHVPAARPVAAPSSPVQGQAFCENCGKPIRAGSTFCPVCGDQQGV